MCKYRFQFVIEIPIQILIFFLPFESGQPVDSLGMETRKISQSIKGIGISVNQIEFCPQFKSPDPGDETLCELYMYYDVLAFTFK